MIIVECDYEGTEFRPPSISVFPFKIGRYIGSILQWGGIYTENTIQEKKNIYQGSYNFALHTHPHTSHSSNPLLSLHKGTPPI